MEKYGLKEIENQTHFKY